MKRYLTILLPAVLAVPLAASAVTDAATENNTAPMFGVKAAFDVNIPGDWHTTSESVKMYRHGYGFTLGGVCNVYLGKGFYLEPGVSFFYDTYSYDDLRIMGEEGTIESENPSVRKLGFRIPVMAGYSFNITDRFSMSVFTGPEVSVAAGGSIKAKNSEVNNELSGTLFDMQRRFDCAWKVGFGVPYNGFLISINAAFGLTDLMKSSNLSFRENRVSVGLTYYF